MTTGIKVTCPSCSASYNVPPERAGARFKCKQCGTTVVVPSGVPSTEKERPVVQPSAVPGGEAAKPVVKPVVKPTVAPVVKPSSPAPAAAPKPVVKPKPAPAPVAESDADLGDPTEGASAVTPSSRQHTRVMHSSRPDFTAEPKGKGKMFAIIGGIVVVVVVGAIFALKGGSSEEPKPQTPETPAKTTQKVPDPPKPEFDATKRIAELRAEVGDKTAAQLWTLSNKLQTEADAWKEKGAPAEAVTKLSDEVINACDKVIELDPEHAAARKSRREVKYQGELDQYVDAKFVGEADREKIRQDKLQVDVRAKESSGWISQSMYDTRVKPVIDQYGKVRETYVAMESSEFGQAAKKLETKTIGELSKAFEGKVAFDAYFDKPYVVFVEVNPQWSTQNEAKSRFNELKALHKTFLRQFEALKLTPTEQPIPVLYFISPDRYQEYAKKTMGGPIQALAHFEPATSRLVLNREVDHEVVLHEGTHQLFHCYNRKSVSWLRQAYWFQEGVAEYFGGSNRVLNKDGEWTYEVGVLQIGKGGGRMGSFRTHEEKAFTLAELVTTTYANKGPWEAAHDDVRIEMVYAQGWFLIYFLNNYAVDEKGMVKIGQPGKYKAKWDKYVEGELDGKTGRAWFMEAMGVDDKGLAALDKEYRDYFHFVTRKLNMNQVKEKKLIAWDQWVNKRGEKNGEESDDLLIPPKK